ncbi:MAG: PQQ-binding-like beta-propeller repeat protein [Pseudomonadota bacterium]
MTRLHPLAAVVLLSAALSACVLNPFRRNRGDEEAPASTQQEAEEDDLIAVLSLDESLAPDPRFAEDPVRTPPPVVNAAWPQAGGRADHALHHLDTKFDVARAWSVNLQTKSGGRSPLTAPPIIVEGRVYVFDALARLHAVDAETGRKLWRSDLYEPEDTWSWRRPLRRPKPQQEGFGGGGAYDGGRVFVASGFGFAAAVDAETGEELWRTDLPGPARTPPTAYRGFVFVTTVTNDFIAIDQASGDVRWDFQSFEEATRILASGSPAAGEDLVVAPFSSGEIIAFRAQNGRGIWDETLSRASQFTSLSSLNDIAGAPVIDRGLVIATSHGGRMAAVDVRSGRTIWELPVASVDMPWVAGKFVYVVSVEGEVVCISREDGAVAWVTPLPRFKNEKNNSGRIAWSGPVLAGDALILASSDGRLAQIAPEDGRLLRTIDIKEPHFLSPVVAGETVYLLSEGGRLAAYR